MKKSMFYIAFVILAILSVTHTNATIRRVGYFGTFTSGTDYADLQSAVNAYTSGDTIYIFPSQQSAIISKKVILIGYGYFTSGTNGNPGLQNINGSNYVSISIFLRAGSDSSIFQGIDSLNVDVTYNSLRSIIINRCKCNIKYFRTTQDKWQITQSYIDNIYYANSNDYNQIFTNLLVSNCYINNFNFSRTIAGQSSGILVNNIFIGITDFRNCPFDIKNSIFISSHINDTYCKYEYNVATTAYPLTNTDGNDTANKNVADISTVFVGYPTIDNHSYDERFNLKSGSIAFTAGEGGTQAGIYGGSDPYQLSGIPPIPAFYKLTAPSTTTSSNPYTITFSVRSNN